MDDGISSEEAAEDAALTQRLGEAGRLMRDLENQGWLWARDGLDRVLSAPGDVDINIWFHPYTGERLLSPKLVERLMRQTRTGGK